MGNPKVILIVDDEPEARKQAAAVVGRLGYAVLTANNGDHALALYERLRAPIDLLLVDVTVPGLSGPMLAERMKARQPGLRVLYTSAIQRSLVVRKYVVERGGALLPKPFTSDQLRARVEAAVLST